MKRIFSGICAGALLISAAVAADSDWVDQPAHSFAAHKVDFGKICGVVTVDVGTEKQVKLQISGTQARLAPMQAKMQGETLHIAGEACPHTGWQNLSFSFRGRHQDSDYLKKLQVHVTVPQGMALSASDVTGVFHIGDTHGAVDFVSHGSGDVFTGDVASADLKSSGSGDFRLKAVAGLLQAALQGSGDLSVESAAQIKVSTSGSGDIAVGEVSGHAEALTSGSGDIRMHKVLGGLKLITSGSGDGKIDSVEGKVDLLTSGSGDIRIKDGSADPFTARTSGSGDIHFGGTARHAKTHSSGFGDIHVRDRD